MSFDDEKARLLGADSLSAWDEKKLHETRLDEIEQYIYKPLPKGSFTRVLEFERAKNLAGAGAEIYCKFRILKKSLGVNVSPYRAVSYAWPEQPELTEKIWIVDEPGVYLPITKEVKQMLGELMRGLPPKKTYRLWADALCINQADLAEKAEQVAAMADIYSTAVEVLVWLGDDPGLSNSLPYISHLFRYTTDPTSRSQLFAHLSGDEKNHLYSSCISVLKSPWFDHRWVIQAAICAKTATIFSGTLQMDFFWLVEAFLFFSDFRLKPADDRVASLELIYGLERNFKERRSLQDYKYLRLNTVDRFRHAKCSDPRDLIFSFAGIGMLDSTMRVDYCAPVEDVFTDFARGLTQSFSQSDKSEFIVLQYACALPSTSDALPSWVPDWRNTRQFRRLYMDLTFAMPPFYNKEPPSTTFRGPRELVVKGFINGRVQSVLSDKVPRACDYPQMLAWEAAMARYLKNAWDIALPAAITLSNFVSRRDPTDTLLTDKGPDRTNFIEDLLRKFLLTVSAKAEHFDRLANIYEPSRDLVPAYDRLLIYHELRQPGKSVLYQFAQTTFLADEIATPDSKDDRLEDQDPLSHRLAVIQAVMEGRSFFVSDNGYMGITSSRCQEGDLVCSFIGAATHFVVRPETPYEYSRDVLELTVKLIGDAVFSFGASLDNVIGDSPRQFIIV